MSIRVMTKVWDSGPQKQSQLLVLLALSDFANDNGMCWPSIKTLSHKARLTERGTQKILRTLEADGWIEIQTGGGRHGCNNYRINPECSSPPEQGSPPNGGSPPPRTAVQETLNGGSPEPLRTIIEPSVIDTCEETPLDILSKWASVGAVESFLAYREKHKAKAVNVVAANRLATTLGKILNDGGDTDDALALIQERGWASIERDWYFKNKGGMNGTSTSNANDATLESIARAARAR